MPKAADSAPCGILARGEQRVATRLAISPGGNRTPGDDVVGSLGGHWPRMETSSKGSPGGKPRRYRITVRGEVSQTFVEPLEHVFVESTGDESILGCEVVDQAKLQAILSWLYARGVEIVSVVPYRDGVNSADPLRQ